MCLLLFQQLLLVFFLQSLLFFQCSSLSRSLCHLLFKFLLIDTVVTFLLTVSLWSVFITWVLFSVSFLLFLCEFVPIFFLLWVESTPSTSQFFRHVRIGFDFCALFDECQVVFLSEENESITWTWDTSNIILFAGTFSRDFFRGFNRLLLLLLLDLLFLLLQC